MKSKDTLGKRVVRSMGTIMMVTWMLILGPIGAVLLGAVAYSMLAKNPIQGVLCGILLFLPLFLTIAWGIERWLHARREQNLQRAALLLATEPIGSPNPSIEERERVGGALMNGGVLIFWLLGTLIYELCN